ncbi:MAG TPA: hypothetical protein VK435_05035, partial [Thermodesulfovibrionales bacterium]|nr:hypothetical protein [Thermodesulfovibrionales bacterium]
MSFQDVIAAARGRKISSLIVFGYAAEEGLQVSLQLVNPHDDVGFAQGMAADRDLFRAVFFMFAFPMSERVNAKQYAGLAADPFSDGHQPDLRASRVVRVFLGFTYLASLLHLSHSVLSRAIINLAMKYCNFVIVRLDRTIQNLLKRLDSPIKSGND